MKIFSFAIVACLMLVSPNMLSGQVSDQADGPDRAQARTVERKTDGQRKARPDGEGRRRGKKGQRGPQRPGGPEALDTMFSRLDANGDGSISLAEAPQRMQNRFAEIDASGDKLISKAELQTAFAKLRESMGQRRGGPEGGSGKKGGPGAVDGQRRQRGPDLEKLLASADKNNDGAISLDEAPERMKKRFDKIDTDGSGTITSVELKAAQAKMGEGGGRGKAKGRKKDGADDLNKATRKPKRPAFDGDAT